MKNPQYPFSGAKGVATQDLGLEVNPTSTAASGVETEGPPDNPLKRGGGRDFWLQLQKWVMVLEMRHRDEAQGMDTGGWVNHSKSRGGGGGSLPLAVNAEIGPGGKQLPLSSVKFLGVGKESLFVYLANL